MKAIWSGAIAFGLVNIPVKLYSAVKESRLDFDMLDKKDYSNIRFKRVNEQTGKEVSWNNIVKGYEINGKYVVLAKSDFDKASPEKTKLITMETFVDPAEIDVILYNSAYYLSPAKGGERAFALLEEVLRKSKRCGVGTFVMRNREHLVIIRAVHHMLILHTLRFLQEIADPADFIIKQTSQNRIKPGEMKMATSLVRSMNSSFDIKNYKDTYTKNLMKIIRARATGKKLPAASHKPEKATGDLVSQLRLSIANRKKRS